ncbi:hypothetical protein BDV06DRAFT_220335 [Aspergillus oleicola]
MLKLASHPAHPSNRLSRLPRLSSDLLKVTPQRTQARTAHGTIIPHRDPRSQEIETNSTGTIFAEAEQQGGLGGDKEKEKRPAGYMGKDCAKGKIDDEQGGDEEESGEKLTLWRAPTGFRLHRNAIMLRGTRPALDRTPRNQVVHRTKITKHQSHVKHPNKEILKIVREGYEAEWSDEETEKYDF